MSHYEWCYVSGRVNVLECSLLSQNFFERLLSSDNLGNVLISLNSTFLKSYFTQVKHLYEFEILLDDYYYGRLYEIRSLSPDSSVCDFFLIKNDVLNFKKFIKSILLGTSVDSYLKGTIDKSSWGEVWHDKTTSLPEIFKESISFLKTTLNSMKKEVLPFIIDLIFDGTYLRYIGEFYNEIEVEIIRQYVRTYQLVKGFEVIRRAISLRFDTKLFNQYFLKEFDQNHIFHKLVITTSWTSEKTLRELLAETHSNMSLPDSHQWAGDGAHSFLHPNGHETLLQILSSTIYRKISFRYEVETDNYLLDMIRSVKHIPFGPEKVFGYLCGLTAEVDNLKLVLGGKVHRIENNLLRERLRKTYA